MGFPYLRKNALLYLAAYIIKIAALSIFLHSCPHHSNNAVKAYNLRLGYHCVGIMAFLVSHTAVQRIPRIVYMTEYETA